MITYDNIHFAGEALRMTKERVLLMKHATWADIEKAIRKGIKSGSTVAWVNRPISSEMEHLLRRKGYVITNKLREFYIHWS